MTKPNIVDVIDSLINEIKEDISEFWDQRDDVAKLNVFPDRECALIAYAHKKISSLERIKKNFNA